MYAIHTDQLSVSFSAASLTLIFAFDSLAVLETKGEKKISARAVGQEQPLVAGGPSGGPKQEEEAGVKKNDRTSNGENPRLMRLDHLL
jgi:hypothetical protein